MDFTRALKDAVHRARKLVFPPRPDPKRVPPWSEIVLGASGKEWAEAKRAAQTGPKILVATSVGGHSGVTPMESLLAVALTLRGANVHFLLCDRFLPACLFTTSRAISDEDFLQRGPQGSLCNGCFQAGKNSYEPWGLPIHTYSALVTNAQRQTAEQLARELSVEALKTYTLDGIAIGEHALSGTLRHYARGTLDEEPNGEEALRRYFKASLLTAHALSCLFEKEQFESAVFHHGIYIPQGTIGEVARQKNVRVANWVIAYRKQSVIFSHGTTYHHTLMKEPTDRWEDLAWTAEIESQTMDYLESRAYGTNDWIRFQAQPAFDLDALAQEKGIDFSKPCIGLLTNVVWDAQLHYPANAFPNMLEWITQSIRYFAKRPELQLIIRVHPAEIRSALPSRQPVVDEVRKVFPELPKNVFIVPPENSISTYDLMLRCNAVAIYGTKTGTELTSRGVPVIVAGEAWIRNKGLTMDAVSPESYFAHLDKLPLPDRLDAETVRRARRYAYHFFFRRMIPLEHLEQTHGKTLFRVRATSLDELQPGRSAGLDIICDGILKGADFIYPAEKFTHTRLDTRAA
jgi:hypothetical protein